jgi:leader peptidase (prepilin peptidase)/N-methyltransferase
VLPEAITIPLFWAGLLLSPFAPDPYARILGSFVACAAMWGSFAFIGWRKKKNIFSGGDIVLAAAAGAWLGIDGVATYLLVAVVLFLAHAVPARLRGHAMTPFGPALSTALFACATASALGLRFL